MFLISKPACKKIIQPIIQPQLLKRTKGTYENDFFGSFSKKFTKQRVVILHAVIAFKKNSHMQSCTGLSLTSAWAIKVFELVFKTKWMLNLFGDYSVWVFVFGMKLLSFWLRTLRCWNSNLNSTESTCWRFQQFQWLICKGRWTEDLLSMNSKYLYWKGCFFFF